VSLADVCNSLVEIWRGPDDAVVAYSATIEDRHWIEMPGVALFRFEAVGDSVQVWPHASEAWDVARDTYGRAVLPMVVQARGAEVLHASAVTTRAGVVAFCGKSRTGKSTIAVGLNRRGYRLWADDTVAFDPSPDQALTMPLPFHVRLRPAAAAFFAKQASEVCSGGDGMEAGQAGPHPEPLAAVCVLERVFNLGDGVVLEPLPPSSAFRAVLPHAFCFSLQDPQCKRRMTEHYLRLVGRVPCFAIRFRPGLEGLSRIMDLIERRVMGA
jgi:hypothetical protein